MEMPGRPDLPAGARQPPRASSVPVASAAPRSRFRTARHVFADGVSVAAGGERLLSNLVRVPHVKHLRATFLQRAVRRLLARIAGGRLELMRLGWEARDGTDLGDCINSWAETLRPTMPLYPSDFRGVTPALARLPTTMSLLAR